MRQYTEQEIRETLGQSMEMSEKAKTKLADAYSQIKTGTVKQSKNYWKSVRRGGIAVAAAAAVMLLGGGFLVSNPAIAAKLPIIGQFFAEIGNISSFPGDYSGVGESLSGNSGESIATEVYSQSADGATMTLSEVYCNDAALYITFEIQTEDGFSDCLIGQDGSPVLALYGDILFSFNHESQPLLAYPDGFLADENTYIGLLRLDLQDVLTEWSDYIQAVEEDEDTDYNEEAYLKYKDLIKVIDLPETFEVHLNIKQIVEDLADPVSIYEAAGEETPTEEEYAAMSEEEWQNRINGLYSKVPDYEEYPNQYENLWYDGPYTYEFNVQVDTEQTVTVSVDEEATELYSIVSVTKTPFELTVEESDIDWSGESVLVVVDAEGRKLPYGKKGGNMNVFQVSGYDLSSIGLYIVSWEDWENLHIKGDYFEENGKNEKGQTLEEVLKEHCLYQRNVTFPS